MYERFRRSPETRQRGFVRRYWDHVLLFTRQRGRRLNAQRHALASRRPKQLNHNRVNGVLYYRPANIETLISF